MCTLLCRMGVKLCCPCYTEWVLLCCLSAPSPMCRDSIGNKWHEYWLAKTLYQSISLSPWSLTVTLMLCFLIVFTKYNQHQALYTLKISKMVQCCNDIDWSQLFVCFLCVIWWFLATEECMYSACWLISTLIVVGHCLPK